jgi:iron complex transport system substrate-binding protein
MELTMKTASTARARIVLGVAAAGLVLASCGSNDDDTAGGQDSASTISVKHAQGTTEVPADPKSVVTFDMASLDTLDALGVDAVTGVPQEAVPSYLKQYAGDDYENVGTLFEPDYEALPALEPDLIIVAGRSAPAYKELSKNFTVIDLSADSSDYLGSVKRNTETLAKIFDKQDEADSALTDLDSRLTNLTADTKTAGSALFLMTSGGELTAFGPGSRFDFVHSVLGLVPAVKDIEHEAQHGEAVSFEFVEEAAPEWLLVLDRDATVGESGDAAQKVLDNALVARTPAWKKDQVVYLDGEAWYIASGGLTSTGTMIGEIESALGS